MRSRWLLLEDSKNFATSSIELDPQVLKALRMIDVYPEIFERVVYTLSPIEAAAQTIEEMKEAFEDSEARALLARYKGISKDLARKLRLSEATVRYRNDAVSLVMN